MSMGLSRAALPLQLGTTLPLVGLIWFVQIVAYPLFARVGADAFPAYHEAHARLITYVVAPLMVLELAGALIGATRGDPAMPRSAAWLGAGLAVAVWIVTFFASVPQHDVLARGFDVRAHDVLVATNWLRTAAWTLRGALLVWVIARAVP